MPKKILVVDDDSELREALGILLRPQYEIIEAVSGEDALRMIESESPDLVLLDMSMPGMNGLETLRRYHPSHPDLPTIMLTGHEEIETARSVLASGARSYVMKPCDKSKIVAEIELAFSPPDPDRPWYIQS